jgi:hypothetical protein
MRSMMCADSNSVIGYLALVSYRAFTVVIIAITRVYPTHTLHILNERYQLYRAQYEYR